MYAEKILKVKFLPIKGVYVLKPLVRTFDAMVYLSFSNVVDVRSMPPGREDYVLLDYHATIDGVYDVVEVMKSLSFNDVGVEEPYYFHEKYRVPQEIEVSIDLSRRLRKMEYTFEGFFEDYLAAVERAKQYVKSNVWKYHNAYLISRRVEQRTNDRVLVTATSPLDAYTRFDVVLHEGYVRARVAGPPVNCLCFLSLISGYNLRDFFHVYSRIEEVDREWKRREYKKYLNSFIPVFRNYLDDLDVKCDYRKLARRHFVKIVVYPFEKIYDENLYFQKILEKKRGIYE